MSRHANVVRGLAVAMTSIVLASCDRNDDENMRPPAPQGEASPEVQSVPQSPPMGQQEAARVFPHLRWPAPDWYRGLTDLQKRTLQDALGRRNRALAAWNADQLPEAKGLLEEVRSTVRGLLDEGNWIRWDIELECFWAEQEVAHPEEATYRVAGTRLPLFRIADHLLAPCDPGCGLEDELQIIDNAIDHLRSLHRDKYEELPEFYRALAYGSAQLRAQRYAEAVASFLAGEAQLASMPSDHPASAMILNQLAGAYLAQHASSYGNPGVLDAAKAALMRSRAILGRATPPGVMERMFVADYLALFGQLEERQNHFAAAAEKLEFACNLVLEQEQAAGRLHYFIWLARLYNDAHSPARALQVLSVLDGLGIGLATELEADRLLESGRAYMELRDYQSAERRIAAALGQSRCAMEHGHDLKCMSRHFVRGISHAKVGAHAAAIAEFERSAEFGLNKRDREVTDFCVLRSRIAKSIDDAAGKKDATGVLATFDELRHARPSFPDVKARYTALAARTALWLDHQATDKSDRTWDTLALADDAIASYKEARSPTGLEGNRLVTWHEAETPFLVAAIAALEAGDKLAALLHFENHAAQSLKYAISETPPAEKELVQLLSQENATLIAWLVEPPRKDLPPLPSRWILVASGDGIQFKQVEASMEIDELVQAVEGDLADHTHPDEWRKSTRDLGKVLLGDILRFRPGLLDASKRGEARPLYLIPPWLAWRVPLQLLPVDPWTQSADLLCDRFSVAYVPSAGSLLELHKRARNHTGKLAFYASPELTWASVEADAVANAWAGETLDLSMAPGPEATLCQGGAPISSLLIVAHSQVSSLDPESSRINLHAWDSIQILGNECGLEDVNIDGVLMAGEVAALLAPWEPDLVTLDSCSSSVGPMLATEGMLGLPQVFLRAGARRVVGALWEVPDAPSTAMLMEHFYAGIADSQSVGSAMRAAQRYLRNCSEEDVNSWCEKHKKPPYFLDPKGLRRYSHPRYWSPFVIIGPQD